LVVAPHVRGDAGQRVTSGARPDPVGSPEPSPRDGPRLRRRTRRDREDPQARLLARHAGRQATY